MTTGLFIYGTAAATYDIATEQRFDPVSILSCSCNRHQLCVS